MDRQPLYSLTAMTGQEAINTRTTVVGGLELPWRLLVLAIIGLITGLLPMMLIWQAIGPAAMLLMPLWITVLVLLFQSRTRRGLQVYRYRQILNRKNAQLNRFILGGAIVDPSDEDWLTVQPGSRPNPKLARTPADQLASERQPHDLLADVFEEPRR